MQYGNGTQSGKFSRAVMSELSLQVEARVCEGNCTWGQGEGQSKPSRECTKDMNNWENTVYL